VFDSENSKLSEDLLVHKNDEEQKWSCEIDNQQIILKLQLQNTYIKALCKSTLDDGFVNISHLKFTVTY
jgi:hypothetical protein